MSKLTDLEICKKIAEIEGYKTSVTNVKKGVWASIYENDYYGWCNPLTDDALCFKLMVKYRVWRWSNPYCGVFNVCIRGVQGWVTSVTFNKAICLAIIEAHTDN